VALILCFIQEKSKEKKVVPGKKEEESKRKKLTIVDTQVRHLILKWTLRDSYNDAIVLLCHRGVPFLVQIHKNQAQFNPSVHKCGH
jgi:hypothetical protein